MVVVAVEQAVTCKVGSGASDAKCFPASKPSLSPPRRPSDVAVGVPGHPGSAAKQVFDEIRRLVSRDLSR